MNKRIMGIFVITLFLSTAVLPVMGLEKYAKQNEMKSMHNQFNCNCQDDDFTVTVEVISINGGFGIAAEVENFGDEKQTDVTCRIAIDGMIFIGAETDIVIDSIEPNDIKIVKSDFIFGIGAAVITATILENHLELTSSGKLLGPLVLGASKQRGPEQWYEPEEVEYEYIQDNETHICTLIIKVPRSGLNGYHRFRVFYDGGIYNGTTNFINGGSVGSGAVGVPCGWDIQHVIVRKN